MDHLEEITDGGSKLALVVRNGYTPLTLFRGGHGLDFTEDTIILEIKQGPYLVEPEKKWF